MSIGQIPWNKGRTGVYSQESIEKMRKGKLGQPAWNKGIADDLTEKICSRCKETKPINEFYKKRKDGKVRVPHCRECQKKLYIEFRSTEHGKETIRNQFKKRYLRKTTEYIEKATKRYLEKPAEIKAENTARYALVKGIIIKQPCEVCGNVKAEMHHHDYSKPLDIKWLCRSCHMKEHRDLNVA